MKKDPLNPKSKTDFTVSYRFALLFFAVVALVVLAALFVSTSGFIPVCMDASLADINNAAQALRQKYLAVWNPNYWMGIKGIIFTIHPESWLPLFPLQYIHSLYVAVSAMIFSGTVFFLARSLRLSNLACLFAAFAALTSSHLITFIFPGHMNKLMTYAFLPLSVLGYLKWLDTRRFVFLVIASLGLGLGMLGSEGPVCYFTGFWFVIWGGLYAYGRRREIPLPTSILKISLGLFLIVLLVSLFAAPIMGVYYWNVVDNQPLAGDATPASNWQYATQFYFPPEEIFSYFTTIQFFGAPDAYWGRDGTPTPIRLSDDYMGLLPLGFAVLGGIVCWRVWQARFFVVMGLSSFLISLGHDGPLFWLIYQLPTMKSQRNPHRWTFFVAFTVCILAAYGLDWLLKQLKASDVPSSLWKKWRNRLGWTALTGVGLAGIAMVVSLNHREVAEMYYSPQAVASSNGPLFVERTRLLLASLVRTGVFLGSSSGVVAWLLHLRYRSQLSNRYLSFILTIGCVILLLDLGLNDKRFIRFYNWKDVYENNPIANLLKQDPEIYRVKAYAPQQNPFLNDLVSNILPFHEIQLVDPPVVSRLPGDFAKLFDFMKNHYMGFDQQMDFFNVKYILTPGMVSDPNFKAKHIGEWNGVHLYQREQHAPRAWLAPHAWLANGSDNILAETFNPARDSQTTVVLEEKPKHVPLEPSPSQSPLVGQKPKSPVERDNHSEVRITHYEGNHLQVETVSPTDAMLVISEKWDPDWKAWVDGKPAKILQANFMIRAVELSAGKHLVSMEYRPSTRLFWVSTISILIFAAWSVVCLLRQPFQKSVAV